MTDGGPDPLSSLSPEQRAAMELLLRRRRTAAPETEAIPRRADPASHPLSFAQQRLWFLDQLAPGDPAYNIHGAVRLRGALDAAALARALSAIAARHEPLRSRFIAAGGLPVQIVDPAGPVPLPVVDLGALPAGEPEALRLAVAEARLPFDLAHGPLLRTTLLRTAARGQILLLTIHHIAADGWSIGVLLRELTVLYETFAAGLPAALPALPIAYADFAAWQRERLRGERLAREMEHWRERLAGLPELRLIPECPVADAGSRGGAVPVAVPPALAERLQALARGAGASLFMVLLAVFQVLLSRWTGERDLAVGSLVANRTRLELEGLIGFFVNTLVLRARLTGAPSFLDLLARTGRTVVDALGHQELPFEKLVEELQPERRLGQTPFVTALFALQNLPAATARLPGLEMTLLPVRNDTASFDLTLTLAEEGGGLAGDLEFRLGVLSAETARRMAGHLGVLLAVIADDPGRPVLDLPFLSAAEREQILGEWSGLGVTLPLGDETFPARFEAQVDRSPEAPAVVAAGRTLSYRDLDTRANRLARRLRQHGVGPETRVALQLERTPEMLVALLGIWKAGGAYVPIDGATPPERQAFLCHDAAVTLELTGEDLKGLDRGGESDERLGLPVLPAQLAYVIYTSGSTGQPKGVMVSHASLAAFARGLEAVLSPLARETPGLRFALNASLAFDASMQAVARLLSGDCVWIVPEEARHDAHSLAELFQEADLDGLDCTPSQLELVLAAMDAAGRPPRSVLVGGEAVPPALWRRMASATRTRFWNVYGPTECTVNVTARRIDGERPERPGAEPQRGPDVGRPWPGVRLWVLEASGLPAPAVARGELWAGGAQLARGYLGRPDLTADRFRPDPFSGDPGERLYRTGDLGRWLSDGRIELLGRADQQVKLRGHRIELGEIEAQLLIHPHVREAAAGVRAGPQGEPRLVAWIVPAGPGSDLQALRRWLGEHLPGPLVPSVLVALDALPKTTSGKLDRRALPDPDQAAGSAGPVEAPADPIEGRLLELFREVLGVQRVLPSDSLFELGGHSLTALRLATRIRESFGVRIAVRRLFAIPTPAGLAAELRGMQRDDTGLPPVRRVPRHLPIPLSLAQQRLWVLHQLTPGLTAYQIPAGLRLRGRLDVPSLHAALTEILRRHEVLRTHFPMRGGEHSPSPRGERAGERGLGTMAPVQAIDPPAPAALPVLDLAVVPAGEREAEARRIAAGEAVRPFDLERGPMLRFLLLGLGPEDHVLFLVVHHLVSDGWSAALFLRELSSLYGAFGRGAPSPLPEPRVQYADWAVWQHEQLHGEVLDAHLRWWSEHLADAPRVLDLPTDRPRPPFESPAGASVPLRLAKPLVESLGKIALAQGATFYMILLAGFQALLARLAAQETVCVGAHVARRHRLEVEGLIGFFVNTVVIRTDVSAGLTGRTLVERVREAVFGAFAHQDLPFERLVEALDPERDPRWSPLFQVSFALNNVPREEPRLAGLEVELLDTDTGTAQFDLAVSIEETGDGAAGSMRYRTSLFSAPTARRLAGHYKALLAGMAEDPDRPVSTLSLLTPAERHQILVEWAGPERPPAAGSLPELFARQAARTPAAPAVVCGKDTMTYGDLDRRSGRLAGWLRRHGAGPETVVAISVERSLEMVVGLLGILRSGAAYLPIDPLNPRERQAFLLDDGGASIVLTQERWAAGLQAPGRKVICLDASDPDTDGHGPTRTSTDLPETTEPVRVGPCPSVSVGPGESALAALLYTSGSTGRPKATLLERRGLLNLCLWFRDVCPITPQTRSLLGFSFSFDAAFKNILVPLLAGGTTVLPPAGPFDAGEMLETIRREAVTFLNTTPSQMAPILRQAAEDGWKGLETLRTLILGGEAPRWADLRPWLLSGRCRAEVLHMYGPSEASDTVSCHRVTRDEILTAERLPAGRAADGVRMLVIDAGLEPLPIGAHGELCLAGAGVARGYLGRPELTAEKFVPDPFHPGERMYRTGDLARWLSDGSVEILGRIDHQVKLRGIRVEPAEVEAALTAHPAIAGAVVGAREDAAAGEPAAGKPAAEKRLIAWLVPAAGAGLPSPAALREHLGESLPEVMIPAAFVPLAAFPVTPRGKIDRNALPDPAGRMETASVPPRDALELRLSELFQEVLGGGDVGVRDSFFDLGGHSLAAVRLAGRIRQAMKIELPVVALFQAPTVEALAGLLRQGGEIAVSPLVSLRAGDREPLFLVHPGGGSAFAYLDLVRRLPPGRPVFGLQAPGLEAGQEPLRDVGAMAELYLKEVRRVQPQGPWHLAGWSFGGLVAFEMARRLRAQGEEVGELVLIDPTDPAARPDRTDPSDLALLAAFARELGLPPEAFDITAEEARQLAPEERWSLLLEKGRETGRLRPGDEAAGLRRRFDVFQACAEATRAWCPGPYDGPLDLIEAAKRPAPAVIWRALARRAVVLPGDHYTLLAPPQVEALAELLEKSRT